MAENIFAEGLFYKNPSEKAPKFIKANISIRVDEFVKFIEKYKKADGFVNLDVKESKAGKTYVSLNTWDKGQTPTGGAKKEEIPVIQDREIDVKDIPF